MLSDTSPDAEKIQIDRLRKTSVAERLCRVREWSRMLVHLPRQGIARANPGLDDRGLDLLWVEQQYGQEPAVKLQEYLEKRPSCKATTH